LLERSGRNLASVVRMLKGCEPGLFERVQEYLSIIAPEVHGFDVLQAGGYETVRFRLRSGSQQTTLALDAACMSDGTLRALAAIVAAFQVVLPHDHPSVIGIEEPETSLHPAATQALVDALQEATEHTQVLLTTHSSDLLASRDIDLSQILVVKNYQGATRIAPVDAASREIIRKELYTLADLQRMDQLDLDEPTLVRQPEASRVGEEG
jgi:predicted ATPase